MPEPTRDLSGYVDGDLYCYGGCGKRYADFGLDVVLPDSLWLQISPRPCGGGVLCANCIVERLGALPDATVARLTVDVKEAMDA